MKAVDLSRYIIAKNDNFGDLITNKKLQKLLYYIESWSLVYLSPIIDEDFEAWVHGPVIPLVYHEYKKFGYSPIRLNYENQSSSTYIENFIAIHHLKTTQVALIDAVLSKYGVLSSHELEMLTHSEEPWLKARQNLSPFEHSSSIIEKSIMKSYYSSLIKP